MCVCIHEREARVAHGVLCALCVYIRHTMTITGARSAKSTCSFTRERSFLGQTHTGGLCARSAAAQPSGAIPMSRECSKRTKGRLVSTSSQARLNKPPSTTRVVQNWMRPTGRGGIRESITHITQAHIASTSVLRHTQCVFVPNRAGT